MHWGCSDDYENNAWLMERHNHVEKKQDYLEWNKRFKMTKIISGFAEMEFCQHKLVF